MGWLLASLAAFLGLCGACIAAVGAFAVAWNVANTKFKKQLHGVTARYHAALRAAAEQPGGAAATAAGDGGGGVAAVYESFTLGWLNLLVQHLWLPVLEKLVSSIAAEKLQIVLNDVLRKFSHRKPWKYIEAVAVEVVTFGLAPPQFQYCTAKYDPARSYLLLTMDMNYHSCGMQAVLSGRIRFGRSMPPFNLRLEIMQLRLAGKLHLGLHLTKEPPGVKGVDYSFASPPDFDIQAAPVGWLNLHGELPGMIGQLRTELLKIINRRIVEPKRKHLDLQRIYRNKHVQRIGGPGGCLRVCVIAGRNLAGASSASAPTTTTTTSATAAAAAGMSAPAASPFTTCVPTPASSSATSDCDPYVEMRVGREVFRTPIVHHTADPVYNWQFDVRLPEDLPPPQAAAAAAAAGSATAAAAAQELLLVFRVLNARTLGEPEVLSGGALDVGALGLVPNADPRVRLLELKGPGAAGPRGTLSLQLSWLKAQPKRASPFAQDAARAAAAAAAAAATAPTAAAAAPTWASGSTSVWGASQPGNAGTPAPQPRHAASQSPHGSSAATTPSGITPVSSEPPPPAAFQRSQTTTNGGGGGEASGSGAAASRRTDLIAGVTDAVLSYARDITGSGPMPAGDGGGGGEPRPAPRPHPLNASSSASSYTRILEAAAATAAAPDANTTASAACPPSPHSSAGSAPGPLPYERRATAAAAARPSHEPLTSEVTLADGAMTGIPARQMSGGVRSIHVTANSTSNSNARASTFGTAYEQAAAAAAGGGGGSAAPSPPPTAAVPAAAAAPPVAAASPSTRAAGLGRISRGGLGRGSSGGTGGGGGSRKQPRQEHPGHRRAFSGLLRSGGWRPLWGGGTASARSARGRTAGGGGGGAGGGGDGGDGTEPPQVTLSATSASAAAAHRAANNAAAASAPHNAVHMPHHNRPVLHRAGAGATSAAAAGGHGAPAAASAAGSTRDYSGPEDLEGLAVRERLPPVPSVPLTPDAGEEGGPPGTGGSSHSQSKLCVGADGDDDGYGGGSQAAYSAPLPRPGRGWRGAAGGGDDDDDACSSLRPVAGPSPPPSPPPSALTTGSAAAAATGTGDASQRGGRRVSQSSAQPGPSAERLSWRGVPVDAAAAAAAAGVAAARDSQAVSHAQDPPFVRAQEQQQLQALGSRSSAAVSGGGGLHVHASSGLRHLHSLSGSLFAATPSYGSSYAAVAPLPPAGPSASAASGGAATPNQYETQSLSGVGGSLGLPAEGGGGGAMLLPLPPPPLAASGGGAGGGQQWSGTFQSLAQVVKLQRLLRAEQAANAELSAALRDARRRCETLEWRRRWENHRALVEGARFSLHVGRDVRRVVLRYNRQLGCVHVEPDLPPPSRGAAAAAAAAPAAAAGGAGGRQEAWPRSFKPEELERAEPSRSLFPAPPGGALSLDGIMSSLSAALLGRARSSASPSAASQPPDPLKCFSLLLRGGRALHLQLPPGGNGRSRDEWVDAMKDLGTCAREEERNGARAASEGAAAGAGTVPAAAASGAGGGGGAGAGAGAAAASLAAPAGA